MADPRRARKKLKSSEEEAVGRDAELDAEPEAIRSQGILYTPDHRTFVPYFGEIKSLLDVSRHFIDLEIVSHPPELLAVGDEGLAAEGLQLQGFAQIIVGMFLHLGRKF